MMEKSKKQSTKREKLPLKSQHLHKMKINEKLNLIVGVINI
jgi:hypothetical protein